MRCEARATRRKERIQSFSFSSLDDDVFELEMAGFSLCGTCDILSSPCHRPHEKDLSDPMTETVRVNGGIEGTPLRIPSKSMQGFDRVAVDEMKKDDGSKKRSSESMAEAFLSRLESLRNRLEEEKKRWRDELDELWPQQELRPPEIVSDLAGLPLDGKNQEKTRSFLLHVELVGPNLFHPYRDRGIFLCAKNFPRPGGGPVRMNLSYNATNSAHATFSLSEKEWFGFREQDPVLLLEVWMNSESDRDEQKVLGLLRVKASNWDEKIGEFHATQLCELWDPVVGESKGSVSVSCTVCLPTVNSGTNVASSCPDGKQCPERFCTEGRDSCVEFRTARLVCSRPPEGAVGWSVGWTLPEDSQAQFQAPQPCGKPVQLGLEFSEADEGISEKSDKIDARRSTIRFAVQWHFMDSSTLHAGHCAVDCSAIKRAGNEAEEQWISASLETDQDDSLDGLLDGGNQSSEYLLLVISVGRSGFSPASLPRSAALVYGTLVIRVMRVAGLGDFLQSLRVSAAEIDAWHISIKFPPGILCGKACACTQVVGGQACMTVGFREDLPFSFTEEEFCHFARGRFFVELRPNMEKTKALGDPVCIGSVPTLPIFISPHGIHSWYGLSLKKDTGQEPGGAVEIHIGFLSFNGMPLPKGKSLVQVFPCYNPLLPITTTEYTASAGNPCSQAILHVYFGNLYLPQGLEGRGHISIHYRLPGLETAFKRQVAFQAHETVHSVNLQVQSKHAYPSTADVFHSASVTKMSLEIWYNSDGDQMASSLPYGSLLGSTQVDLHIILASAAPDAPCADGTWPFLLVDPYREAMGHPTVEVAVQLSDKKIKDEVASEQQVAPIKNEQCTCDATDSTGLHKKIDSAKNFIEINVHKISALKPGLCGKPVYIMVQVDGIASTVQTRAVEPTNHGDATFYFRKNLLCELPNRQMNGRLNVCLVQQPHCHDSASAFCEAEPDRGDAVLGEAQVDLCEVRCASSRIYPIFGKERSLVANLHGTFSLGALS